MHDAPPLNSVEQRRKLLKGALAASGVATMGYSGAALASFGCVAQVRSGTLPSANFKTTQPTNTPGGAWAWVEGDIARYREVDPSPLLNGGQCPNNGNNEQFYGFTLGSSFYKIGGTSSSPSLENPPLKYCKDTDQTNIPSTKGWVLAYFDDGGSLTGTYPTYSTVAQGNTPAQQSCLASVNPGLSLSNFTFGG